jgi:hypothetical protein
LCLGPITLKKPAPGSGGAACLGIDNVTGALMMTSCAAGAARFAISANGTISSGHGCAITQGAVSYKYAPGNVFPDEPNHGLRLVDSPGQCCSLCQSLKNCSYWTADTQSWAKPLCYGMPGGCCFLKTAAAAGQQKPTPAATSGSRLNVPYCMDALPTLHMTACGGSSATQAWTTAGGMIKEAKSGGGGLCLRTTTTPVPPPPPPIGLLFDVEVDLTVGLVMEAALSCGNASTSAGFLVHGSSGQTSFLFNCASQTFTVGGGQPIDRKPGFAVGAAVALKMLLVRHCPATPSLPR